MGSVPNLSYKHSRWLCKTAPALLCTLWPWHLAGPAPVSVLLLQLWGQDEGPSTAGGQKGLLILTHNTTFSYHQPPQWGEDLRHDQGAGGTFCHHDPVRSGSRSDQS